MPACASPRPQVLHVLCNLMCACAAWRSAVSLQVDTIYQHKLLPRVYQKWGLDPKEEIKLVDLDKKQRLIMTRDQSLMAIPWAIGAMLAGGSDGLLSVVIFAEAKAVKGDKVTGQHAAEQQHGRRQRQ